MSTKSMTNGGTGPAVVKPAVTIALDDYMRLAALGGATLTRFPDVAAFLLEEIDRATVVPIPPETVVGMGSEVEFREERSGRVHRVRLVYPYEADIGEGRISVLTPVGAALIGLAKGASISWSDQAGRDRLLTVLDVRAPEVEPMS